LSARQIRVVAPLEKATWAAADSGLATWEAFGVAGTLDRNGWP
jgi:hypothetical protein